MEQQEKAILVGVHKQLDHHFEYEMEELQNLAEAIGIETAGIVTQNVERIHAGTYVGTGKVDEIKGLFEALDADLVIFNDELSPSQIRNLEAALECEVMDRTMLILAIFSRRAKTREAKMQVELAQHQYMLPRLVGLRASLSRQGGGTGGGFKNRGAGETKLELDRRKIEEQISRIKRELETVKGQRDTQRKRRQKQGLPVVSLVGYTNAGKSTIMNQLMRETGREEDKQVFEKDMLFATLETSVRQVKLEDQKEFLLTDTVGFVSKLPTHLIKAFRSTLEEARDADLLLHVVDVSNEEYRYMMDITSKTLEQIGVEDVPTLYVFNKSDLAGREYPTYKDDQLWISAKEGVGISELVDQIKQRIFTDYQTVNLVIPFDQGDIVSYLNANANVLETEYEETGTRLKVEVSSKDAARLAQFQS
ncbi:GTPase HflX [Chryseomicrobium palamuruense]|uniref:GTPase HflX n=1 Tax=Chryseomicrobium palamuruense TaxID=682973 RepID=A0ABV8UUB5_9BACL